MLTNGYAGIISDGVWVRGLGFACESAFPQLADLARSSPLPVELEATPERLPEHVEAAAYFVACKAVTNAVKHASASCLRLRASYENGCLLLRVSDDGVGGADAGGGSGLLGLADRVDAHGGTLLVDSPASVGTGYSQAPPEARPPHQTTLYEQKLLYFLKYWW